MVVRQNLTGVPDEILTEASVSHNKSPGQEQISMNQNLFLSNVAEVKISYSTNVKPSDRAKITVAFPKNAIGLTRGYEGSGLGLSIAKGFVELLGGKIDLKSDKGKGTEVFFTLPAEIISEPQTNNPEEKENQFGDKVVLIAEDDEMNRIFLETVLKGAGIPFLSVENGHHAVEKCREDPEIGVVLMDSKMPVMDGYEVTRQIKVMNPELPIIAITAQAMQGDRKKALQAGVTIM